MSKIDILAFSWKSIQEDPFHIFIELLCFGIIIYLYFRKPYDPEKKKDKRTKQDEEELLTEWAPEPLVPASFTKAQAEEKERKLITVESEADAIITADGKKYVNFSSFNFLGLANHPKIKEECKKAIDKYGVGSCGPRGFYGTIDVHLDFEKEIARFMGVPESILYSDSIACAASVVPAFAKRGDTLVVDEGIYWGLQQGVYLSRAHTVFFKHNDMEDLKRVLESIRVKDQKTSGEPLNRRFIIVEGIYQNFGDMVNLKRIIELKNEYKYRVILDDTMALGVLGKKGRGSIDHWDVKVEDVDILCAGLDATVATTGGFCIGSHQVVDHQRLSGAGYCFSASSPPYTCTAGIIALQQIDAHPNLAQEARTKAALMRKLLKQIDGVEIAGDDLIPLIHMRLSPKRSTGDRKKDAALLQRVVDAMMDKDVAVTVPTYIPAERAVPTPSIRVSVIANHSEEHIKSAAAALKEAFKAALSTKN